MTLRPLTQDPIMTRPLSTTAAVAGLLLALAPAAQAQEAASQACYVPASGTVYVIGLTGTPTSCADGHTEVTLQGPQGVPGPQGQPGASGFQVVMENIVGVADNWIATVNVACPAGKVPVGGGVSTNSSLVTVSRTQPKSQGGTWTWESALVWDLNGTPVAGNWGVGYAVCLAVN